MSQPNAETIALAEDARRVDLMPHMPDEWRDLDARDKRQILARDALALLRLGLWAPVRGNYYSPDRGEETFSSCVTGALYVVACIREGSGMPQTFGGWGPEKIFEIFGHDNAKRVEFAFEQWNVHQVDHNPLCDERVRAFGLRYDDAHDRAVAILQNVVDNRGDFTP